MKRLIYFLSFIMPLVLLTGCGSMRAPVISYFDQQNIRDYTYFYVMPTNEISLSSGVYGNQFGVYGGETKSIYPSDVISGILLKNGFIRVNEILPENAAKTMIVNFGESGRRNVNLGYSIEVTIQFINAVNHKPIVVCTAEGQGNTEVDDIREAINRALKPLFESK